MKVEKLNDERARTNKKLHSCICLLTKEHKRLRNCRREHDYKVVLQGPNQNMSESKYIDTHNAAIVKTNTDS